MITLLIGLASIIGAFLGVYLIVFLAGLMVVFFTNINPWSSTWIPYERSNIMHHGGKGICILIIIGFILIVAFMVGESLTELK